VTTRAPPATPLASAGVITAIVMVAVEANRIPEVAEAIAGLDGVSEVYSVAGDVDLIAIVRVTEFDAIAEVIAGRLSKVDGVVHTDTHIAFRAYSRHDLESTFSLGLD
jgi:DNA-binding Lrp family transcriptional regulator